MDTKRLIALLLSVTLLAGTGLAIYLSAIDKIGSDRAQQAAAQAITVRGLIGSEKEAFCASPQVEAALARHGITVQVEKGVRWRDLKANDSFRIARSVIISSTDARTSNSAAMYLALASYSANGMNILQDPRQADRVAPLMTELFLRQGLQERSSAGPFEDYVALGIGKAPLVMIYESQFLEYQAARKTRNPDLLAACVKEASLEAPLNLIDVVDPPTFELLERLIDALDKRMT